jgi:ribosome-binding protein aMBF1 (putative translation factor)
MDPFTEQAALTADHDALVASAKSKLTVAEWEALADHLRLQIALPVPPTGETLGRTIARARFDRGMSRRQLATAANMSYPYLSEIENDHKQPGVAVCRRIGAALGLDLAPYLFTA